MTIANAAAKRRPISIPLKLKTSLLMTGLIGTLIGASAQAQTVGALLWEENFDSLNTEYWNVIEGDGCDIGLCGWGNQELENYRADNVTIEAVPGESGNNALVLEARHETYDTKAYTSGKLDSENGVTVHYGMIETRIRVPDVQGGLWPAFWMLGTSTAAWPAKGELDIMEMGHSDSAITGHGHEGTNQNNFVGANAISYQEAACVVGNETCAASSAWQTDNAYVSATPMNDRFIIYRMYWTETDIRFSAIDNGVEEFLYDEPIAINEETAEFSEPFYFLMNMAVGGTFNGLLTEADITSTFPAKMYIDYVRVYELDGLGEVTLGNPTQVETGTFGVFTDLSSTDNQLYPGANADIYAWSGDSLAEGTEAAYEGSNAIAWEYTNPGMWFGGGIQSRQVRDMSGFADGDMSFWIKIPADVSFRVGITDSYSNQNWVYFPANTTAYGLERDGEWGKATVPVSDLRGSLVAIQSLEYLFAILSEDTDLPSSSFQFAIDDILWEGGPIAIGDSDNDGINDNNDQCPNTPAGTTVDNTGCPVTTGGASVVVDTVNVTQANSSSWTSVSFSQSFSSAPIVVMGDPSYNGSDPSTYRIRNITASGFEFQLDEWDYRDGGHVTEQATYIATQAGTHDWGGLQVTAGTTDLTNSWSTVSLADSFADTPVVLARQVSNNDGAATTTRIRNVDTDSFQIRLQEEENADGSHASESVHYIAIATGTGSVNGQSVSAGLTSREVSQDWSTIDFNADTQAQYFLGGMQSYYGSDTANTRYRNLSTSSVEVQVDEEQSANSEVTHTTEIIGWVIIGEGDTIPVDTDSDNDGVNDDDDLCPGTASGINVDSDGCEVIIDSDNDGIEDDADQCPNTAEGTSVDVNGCPIVSNPVAISGSASASSAFQAAALAQDNNPGTRWESTHGVDPSWLALDLGDTYDLSQVTIDWEAANAADYLIQGSSDGNSWTTLATYTGGSFGARTDTLNIAGSYRYVRMYGTARSQGNQWGYSIYQMTVEGQLSQK